jgi:L-ascorbate metabolism protein UlaG (beta-lactamase superfamily)
MVKVKYFGHAGFQIEVNDLNLIFDPWIEGNPMCALKNPDEVEAADYVFISHDHGDHGFNEGVAIAKKHSAKVAGINELAIAAEECGVQEALRGNTGGSITNDDLTVKFTRAYHSCDIGTPCGFLVDVGGYVIYHAGDTDFFSDMQYLSKDKPVDLALLPIGSCFTMGPQEAAWAVEKIKPRVVIPMHYNTFPPIVQNPAEFVELVKHLTDVKVLEVGETIIL